MRFQIGSAYLTGFLLCSSVASGADLTFRAEVGPGLSGTGQYASVSEAITPPTGQVMTATEAAIKLKGDTTENPQSDLSTLTTITLENGKDSLQYPTALVSLQGGSTTSSQQFSF